VQDESEIEDEGENQSRESTDAHGDHEFFATYMDKIFQLCHSLWGVSAESCLVKRVEGWASNRIVSNSVIRTDRGFCVATTNLPGIANRPYLGPSLPEERSVLRGVKFHENNEAKQENLPAEAENIRRKAEKLNLPETMFSGFRAWALRGVSMR
jgi:hypothetical protein